jgi:hypothetical protein
VSATALSSLNAPSEAAAPDTDALSDAFAAVSAASVAPLSLSVVAIKRRYEEDEDDLEVEEDDLDDEDDFDDFDDEDDFDDFDDEDDFDDFDDEDDFDDFDDEDSFDDEELEDRLHIGYLLRQVA